jgi:hypothetical protein
MVYNPTRQYSSYIVTTTKTSLIFTLCAVAMYGYLVLPAHQFSAYAPGAYGPPLSPVPPLPSSSPCGTVPKPQALLVRLHTRRLTLNIRPVQWSKNYFGLVSLQQAAQLTSCLAWHVSFGSQGFAFFFLDCRLNMQATLGLFISRSCYWFICLIYC